MDEYDDLYFCINLGILGDCFRCDCYNCNCAFYESKYTRLRELNDSYMNMTKNNSEIKITNE